jgi:hypothetical protein
MAIIITTLMRQMLLMIVVEEPLLMACKDILVGLSFFKIPIGHTSLDAASM